MSLWRIVRRKRQVSFAISGVGFFAYVTLRKGSVDKLELFYALTQLVNLAIFADFFYYYLKWRRRGGDFVLPASAPKNGY